MLLDPCGKTHVFHDIVVWQGIVYEKVPYVHSVD